MTGFIYKQINGQKTVAEELKSKRQELGFNLEKISTSINIPIKYLYALENGEYDKLPGEVYAKLWLKKYCQILKLNISEIIKKFQKENKLQLSFSDYHSKKSFKSQKLVINFTPKIFRNLLVGTAVLVFLVYLGLEVKKIIEPPYLQISEPGNYIATTDNKVTIIGKTEPEVSLWINNQLVLANPEGNFQQDVELLPGLNTFEISAKKKHSQKNIVTLSVIKNTDKDKVNNEFEINNLGLSLK